MDKIHQLGIKSIGGDQSEYRQALKQFENNLVADQTFLGLLNKEAEVWGNAVESGNTGSYLTHAPKEVQDQRNLRLALIEDININDGANLKTSYDNGVKILTYTTPQNGYTLKNGTQIPGGKTITINSKEYLKDGKGLVKYQEDLSTNISDIWDKYKESYNPIKEKLVEKISATGTTALGGTGPGKQTQEWKDYEKANELLEKQLNEDLEIEALINVEGEMLHQKFVNDDDPYTGTPAQKAEIKERLIEHIKNRYGQQDKITSTITVDTSKAP